MAYEYDYIKYIHDCIVHEYNYSGANCVILWN